MTSRRRFGAVILMMLALLLPSCSAPGTAPAASGQFHPLRIGTSFGDGETVDPITMTSPGGSMLAFYVYDSLARMTTDGVELSLAEAIHANDSAEEWTIEVREGLTFSDGTPVSGQDVLDSLAHLAQAPAFASFYADVDFASSSAEGQTVVLRMQRPAADFLDSVLGMISPISPAGQFSGIGAGPYVLVQGDTATGYELAANTGYWAGPPAISQVFLVPVPDSAARANALATGEIDYALGLDAAALATLSGNPAVTLPQSTLDSANALGLTLNTRVAPFDDPQARWAAKLTLDRDKMVSTLLGAAGEVGNDMLGKGYASYPDEIAQTVTDKAEARRIFAEKGITAFTMITSDVLPGLSASAELMVQEFAEVGVEVTVQQVDPQTFYANMAELYQASAFTMAWINRTPSAEFRMQISAGSPYNMSGYTSPTLTANYQSLIQAADRAEQERLVAAISQEIHDQGGDLIWGFQKQMSAYRTGLEGVVSFQSMPWLTEATFNPVG